MTADAGPWVEDLRAARGLPPLAADRLLALVAGRYAAELAGAGLISHVSPTDGSTAMERLFRGGGSALLVGEIIGAGPSLGDVCAAWEASPSHLAVVLDGRYTHHGAGMAERGGQEVWVVLFAREAIDDLAVSARDGSVTITGRLVPSWAAEPRAIDAVSGTRVPIASWDPLVRTFACVVPLRGPRGHWLLGCLTTDGDIVMTDSVTWPRAASAGGP